MSDNFTPLFCLIDLIEVKSEQEWVRCPSHVSRHGSNSGSTVFSSNSRQAFRPFSLGPVSLLVVHTTACESIPFAWSCSQLQRNHNTKICSDVEHVSSASSSDIRNQFHCCRRPIRSQAPDSAATNSTSLLLSAIVDYCLLVEVIGYQQSLPFTHDAVPLTLNRSASPAQSASPYVNTEPSRARFTASRLKDIGCAVMIPGFHKGIAVLT